MSQKRQNTARNSSAKKAAQSPIAAGALGAALRKEYQDVLSEPIPDRLNALIEKLRSSETKS